MNKTIKKNGSWLVLCIALALSWFGSLREARAHCKLALQLIAMLPFMSFKRKRRSSWIPIANSHSLLTPDIICNEVPSVSMNNVHVPEPIIEDDGMAYCIAQTRRSVRSLLAAVAASLVVSWLLGAAGLSLAWLLLLVTAVLARWNSQFVFLLAQARWEEQQRVRKRRSLTTSETAEWLNILLNKWWTCSGESLFRLVRERIEPLLNESKPSFVERVELEQFTLGEQTPCIESVRSLHDFRKSARTSGKAISLGSVRHEVCLEIGLCLNSEDFRMILRARLFGKGVGMDVDVAMEKLYLCGKLAVTFTVDMESPFPHVSNISISFTEKPDLWFSIRILKSVQMMEVPIIKTWLHSVVVDAIESALVDPGQISFNPSGTKFDAPTPDGDNDSTLAQGILTVTLSSAPDVIIEGDQKWIVLRLGSQYWKTSIITTGWTDCPSFLISSLQKDKLNVKLKSKRLVSSVTLAQYEMGLEEYNLDTNQSVETFLQKRNPRTGQIPNIALRLEYTPLQMVNIDQPAPMSSSPNNRFGVLSVFVHSADGLSSNDSYQCNPYCMIFNNRKKVKSTPYLLNTIKPHWEAQCQLIVNDYSQAALSFVVCSWNPKKMTDDEMLGVAVLNLTQDDIWLRNKQIPLSGSPNASLKVSVVFQAVSRVSRDANDGVSINDTSDSGRIKRNSSSWVHQAKTFLGRVDQEVQSGADISNLLASGMGLMEVTLIRARDLVAMDMNGFSDPYCELKVNSECKYKSSVKKKTLNPLWEENAIMGMPRLGETFDVMVWDHDTFGMKDFLGSVAFTLDDIRQISHQGEPLWCSLQGVKTGELQLRIKIISEDVSFDACSLKSSSIGRMSAEPSPLPRRASMERSRVRLGVHVPPPTPPRTVSIPKHPVARESPDLCMPIVTVTDSPCMTRANSQASSHLTVESLPPSPVLENAPTKIQQEMSSFRSMRLKVSRSLRLRRFKSEVNVRGATINGGNETIKSPSEQLNHAVSQPNINKPQLVRPTELNLNGRPDTYTGVEGKVIQAQGLHVAHVAQLYCTIKLLGIANQRDKQSLGKTLAKSHLQPAMPNPQFQLNFQISSPEAVPRQAALLFEIRSSTKEVLALRRVTLQDLLAGDLKETHTWLALNNGATLEVSVGYGHVIKKKSKKLFRSWSVHRIGKI